MSYLVCHSELLLRAGGKKIRAIWVVQITQIKRALTKVKCQLIKR